MRSLQPIFGILFAPLFGQAKVEMNSLMFNRKLHGIALLLMGSVTLLGNGPNPEIMLAIDFRGPFCATFWTSKK